MLPVIVIVPFSCDRISSWRARNTAASSRKGRFAAAPRKAAMCWGQSFGAPGACGASRRERAIGRRGAEAMTTESSPCRFRRFATEVEGPASIGKSRGQPDTGTLWSSLKQRSSCA